MDADIAVEGDPVADGVAVVRAGQLRVLLGVADGEGAGGRGLVTAGFSSYDGEFRMPLVLAQASPIFHSSCEGKLGIALE